jgi:hypothetical protein
LTRTEVFGNVRDQAASTSAVSGSPTKNTARTAGAVDRAARSQVRATDGTAVTTVIRLSASQSTASSGPVAGTTSVAPDHSAGTTSRRLASKLSPARNANRSPGPNPKRPQNHSANPSTARAEPRTGFGTPVEPEVK